MAELAIFTYGLLTTFVLSGAKRNHQNARPHSRVLEGVGYILMGLSVTLAVALLVYAGWHLANR